MNDWLQFGLPGIVIVGLSSLLKVVWDRLTKIEERHREERREWENKSDERARETNNVIRENTNILSGLKTLLENRK